MLRLLDQNQKPVVPSAVNNKSVSKSTSGRATLSSPESCISNGSIPAQDSNNLSLLDTDGASTDAHSTCCQARPCNALHDNAKETEGCQISDCGSANSIVEDGGDDLKMGQSEQNSGSMCASCDASYTKIDVNRIRERLKKRRLDRKTEKKLDTETDLETDNEAWIEKELESGVEKLSASPEKRKRC